LENQYFIINEQRFEIDFFSKSKAYELQNRISALVNGELSLEIDRYLSKVIPDDILLRFEQLSIDLGTVTYDRLEEEVIAKFMESFQETISQQLLLLGKEYNHQNSHFEVLPIEQNLLQLLEYYLRTGTLPWWAEKNTGLHADTVLDQLISSQPQALADLIKRLGHQEYVRRRIVARFNNQRIAAIINLMEPADAAFIIGYHTEVVKAQQQKQVVQAESASFEKAVWYFILTYLLTERGSEFNKKDFTRSTIRQIASAYNISYQDLLKLLYRALVVTMQQIPEAPALAELIQELVVEENLEPLLERKQDSVLFQIDTDKAVSQLELIRSYLLTGAVSVDYQNLSIHKDQLRAILIQLAQTIPATLRSMLQQISWNKEVKNRLFVLLQVDGSKQFLAAVLPERSVLLSRIGGTFALLHKEKQTWQLNEKDFQAAIWESLLSMTLLPANAVEENRLPVRLVMSGIASHFHIDQRMVAGRVLAGLKSVFRVDQMQMEHLTLIQQEAKKYQSEIEQTISLPDNNRVATLEDGVFNNKAELIAHVLRFQLQFGALPWWGSMYAGQAPQVLLHELLQRSLHDVRLLFRFAGSDRVFRERWMRYFPTEITLRVLLSLNTGDDLYKAWKQWMPLSDLIRSEGIVNISAADMEQMAVQVSWDMLQDESYLTFNPAIFHIRILLRLMHITGSNAAIVLERLQELSGSKATPYGRQILQLQQLLLQELPEAAPISKKQAIATDDAGWIIKVLNEQLKEKRATGNFKTANIEMLATSLKAGESIETNLARQLVLTLLQEYLQTGTLPAGVKEQGQADIRIYLKQLFMLAHHLYAERLQAIFLQPQTNLVRWLGIVDTLDERAGGFEKLVHTWAVSISKPLTDTFVASVDIVPAVKGKAQLETFVIDVLLGKDLKADQSGDIWQNAIAVYQYMLHWNRLPTHIQLPSTVSVEQWWLHFSQWIFQRNEHGWVQMFQGSGIDEYAVVRLVWLMQQLNDVVSRRMLNALRSTLPGLLFTNESELRTFIGRSDKNWPEIEHELLLADDAWYGVLSKGGDITPSLVQTIAAQHYISLPAQSGQYKQVETLFLKGQYGALMADITAFRNWISDLFTDTLEKDSLLYLMRLFHVWSWARGIEYDSRENYQLNFFRFVSVRAANADHLLRVLLADLEKTAPESRDDSTITVLRRQIQSISNRQDAEAQIRIWQEERQQSLMSRDALAEKRRMEEAVRKERFEQQEKERRLFAEEAERQRMEKNTRIFVPNAGLVILHTFFSTYFTRTGLMENGQFIDPASQQRAVLLLQYLVSGRTAFEEHELVLNKILVGLSPEFPVAFDFEPTENEQTVTDELFTVLKERWPKVQNSSVDSIRASFLMRDGALEMIEENWNLKVEQRGYDLLLQTLPWAFGFIKTGWMKQILTVEWI
jgi:hypothetical protein